MAAESGNLTSNDTEVEMNIMNNSAPLWKYVTRLDKTGKAGGNIPFKCNICKKTFKGSYFRVKGHLLKEKGKGIRSCEKVTKELELEMAKVVEEAELRVKQSLPRHVSLPTTSSSQCIGSSASGSTLGLSSLYEAVDGGVEKRKRKLMSGPLEKAFNMGAREALDGEIARMFYTGGLSFHFSRNPHYVRAFTRACSNPIPGYVPPGYNKLRTTLLQKEKNHIERLLEPTKNTWKDKGVSLCSDGWSDSQRRPLINIMAVCESGPMFLKAINTQGEYKDKFYISSLLVDTIRAIGPQNVVQIITDNAPVCKAAGLLVEAKFRHIFWTPCVVHTLNLALKGICSPSSSPRYDDIMEQCGWIPKISESALVIKVFIMNHSMRLAMYNNHCKLKLLSVADTRFASAIVMLKRFKQIKQGLQQMVISDQWESYKEDDMEKARSVKEKILDEDFWTDIDYILDFTAPIYEMLRKADTDVPCLHLAYEWWDSMIEKVKMAIYRKEGKQLQEQSRFFDVVYGILIERWTKSSTPLHCLAHSLNPRYYSKEWLEEDTNRVAPHKDYEITKERKKCLERFFPLDNDRRKINEEFAAFSMCLEDYASCDSMDDRGLMAPVKWWGIHGSSTPTLQSIAFKLLGQPCSSSCCERNWSTYNFIHSVKRNQITPERAEDLVYVHYNLRLLSRKTPLYNEGVSQMWDVGGDGFDSMDLEGGGMLEIADLSLDEPELEAMLFTNDDNDLDD